MAIADYAAYLAKMAAPFQSLRSAKTTTTTVAARSYSTWATSPNGGTAPTTPAVPIAADVGAMGQVNGAAAQHILGVEISVAQGALLLLCDRLSHQGGLDGTGILEQTTNLPTAALTRYTTGEGVHISLDIYSSVGTTGTTVTAKYTNQAGTANQVTPATVFGGSGFGTGTHRSIDLPLAAGDTGVRSVESITLAGSTLGVGNFGVVLYKPLLFLPVSAGAPNSFDPLFSGCGNFPQIVDNAHLFWRVFTPLALTGIIQSVLHTAEV